MFRCGKPEVHIFLCAIQNVLTKATLANSSVFIMTLKQRLWFFFDRWYIALHTTFQCSVILFRRGYWRNSIYEILKSFWTSKISPLFIIIKSLNQCCTFLTSSVVHELKHSSDKDFNKDTRVSILKLSPNLDCVCFMHKGNFHPTNIEK